jgi:hypothetical protein
MHGNFRNKERWGRIPWIWKLAGVLVLIPGFIFLGTWIVMLLWNALIPGIFGLPMISFWQMMGLFVLIRILFGGFHRGRPGGRSYFPGKPRFEDREAWKEHMRERFAAAPESSGD